MKNSRTGAGTWGLFSAQICCMILSKSPNFLGLSLPTSGKWAGFLSESLGFDPTPVGFPAGASV